MALALAVVVGVIVGVVLFNRLGPFPSPSGQESPASGSPSPSAAPTDSPTSTPSAEPTPSPSPTQSDEESPDDPAPPFTQDALVSPEHLLERGWETVRPVNQWDGLPPDQITKCTAITADDGVIDAHAATIDGTAEGEQPISSAEVVARFEDEATAEKVMADLVRRVNACSSAPPGESTMTPGQNDHPDPDDKVDESVLWPAEGEGGQSLAMIGLSRADDRIALITLGSVGKDGAEPLDPFGSLDVFELTTYAGRRLV